MELRSGLFLSPTDNFEIFLIRSIVPPIAQNFISGINNVMPLLHTEFNE